MFLKERTLAKLWLVTLQRVNVWRLWTKLKNDTMRHPLKFSAWPFCEVLLHWLCYSLKSHLETLAPACIWQAWASSSSWKAALLSFPMTSKNEDSGWVCAGSKHRSPLHSLLFSQTSLLIDLFCPAGQQVLPIYLTLSRARRLQAYTNFAWFVWCWGLDPGFCTS